MRVYCKAVFSLLIVLAVMIANASFAFVYAKDSADESIYLLVGIDEAGQNTDSLMLVKLSSVRESISVVHIPRDSLIKNDDGFFKINAVFSRARSSGLSELFALSALREYISDIFSLDIDCGFLISKEAVVRLVDAISGVDIKIDEDLNITDSKGNTLLRLRSGINHLSGSEAYIFLRHRASYADADIGRIKAQDRFIEGLFNKLREVRGLSAFTTFYRIYDKYVVNDAEHGDLLRLSLAISDKMKPKSIDFYTLPGEEIRKNGVSYYALNPQKTDSIIKGILDINGGVKDNSIFIP